MSSDEFIEVGAEFPGPAPGSKVYARFKVTLATIEKALLWIPKAFKKPKNGKISFLKKILLIGGGEIGTEIGLAALEKQWLVRAIVSESPLYRKDKSVPPIANLLYYHKRIDEDCRVQAFTNNLRPFEYVQPERISSNLSYIMECIQTERPDIVLLEDIFMNSDEWKTLYTLLEDSDYFKQKATFFIPSPRVKIRTLHKSYIQSDIFLDKEKMKEFLAETEETKYYLNGRSNDKINIAHLEKELAGEEQEDHPLKAIRESLADRKRLVFKLPMTSSGYGQFILSDMSELTMDFISKMKTLQKMRVENEYYLFEKYIADRTETCLAVSQTTDSRKCIDGIFYAKYDPLKDPKGRESYPFSDLQGITRLRQSETKKDETELWHKFRNIGKKIQEAVFAPFVYVEFIVDENRNNSKDCRVMHEKRLIVGPTDITPKDDKGAADVEASVSSQKPDDPQKEKGASPEKKYDVFICHASEDKETFVRELANALRQKDLRVWYDEFALTLGDSLRRKIDQGLANSCYGVVVLSEYFFLKEWPKKELDGLVAKETGLDKVILPIWHGVTKERVLSFSPILADRLAVSSNKGMDIVVEEILRAIKPKIIEKQNTSNEKNENPIFYVNEISYRPDDAGFISRISHEESQFALFMESLENVLKNGYKIKQTQLLPLNPLDEYVCCTLIPLRKINFTKDILDHKHGEESLPHQFPETRVKFRLYEKVLSEVRGKIPPSYRRIVGYMMHHSKEDGCKILKTRMESLGFSPETIVTLVEAMEYTRNQPKKEKR